MHKIAVLDVLLFLPFVAAFAVEVDNSTTLHSQLYILNSFRRGVASASQTKASPYIWLNRDLALSCGRFPTIGKTVMRHLT